MLICAPLPPTLDVLQLSLCETMTRANRRKIQASRDYLPYATSHIKL